MNLYFAIAIAIYTITPRRSTTSMLGINDHFSAINSKFFS